MKPEEIKLSDWSRIIFGEVPPEFYLELIIRAILVYFLLVLSMRLLGKRMSTQMSRLELAAMVALASAIGVPMLSADRGILPAYIIAFVIIVITRLIARKSFKDQHFEEVTQGNVDCLVIDSVMNYDVMKKVRVSRERLFSQMRSECILNLGTVNRVYMEANGGFSIIPNSEPKPGLMTLPDWDKDFISRKVKKTDITICKNCGIKKPENIAFLNGDEKCENCKENVWTKAVIEI